LFAPENIMNSEFIYWAVIIITIAAALYVPLMKLGSWLDGDDKRNAMYAEFERLINQSPEARAAYQTLEAEARKVLREMGQKEIALNFLA
jgi:hypothetical protein